MNKQFIFITVNYNNPAHTIKYVESINSQNYKNVSIIIVDNDSNHKDVEELSSALAKINNATILKNNKNVGYFRGLNIGIAHVKKTVQDFENVLVVVSNNDLIFGADFVRILDEYSCNEDDFSIVPDIVDNDGLHQNPLFISRISAIRRFGYALYFKNYYLGRALYWLAQRYNSITNRRVDNYLDKPTYIYMAIGACYVLTSNYFKHFEMLDDQLFLMGEETILSHNIYSAGGRIIYLPSLIVYHDESSSIKKMTTKELYETTKNSYKIYSKYY